MSKELNTIKQEEITTVQLAAIDLRKFPPKLRQLGKYLLQSESPITMTQACIDLNLNRASIGTLIYKAKQKGNDFSRFIEEQRKSILHLNKLGVYRALVKGAVEGSAAHIKLFAQITGDLEENRASAGITIKHLTIGVSQTGARPADLSKEKGIIDLDPEIPPNKRT